MKKFFYIFILTLMPAVALPQNTDRFNTPGQTPPVGRMMNIFPNPGKGMFTVMFNKNCDIFNAYTVYDPAGKQVYFNDQLSGNPLLVDLSHFQPGIYILVFRTADRKVIMTEKVAIVK